MSAPLDSAVLPYSLVVGQAKLKLALELAYVAPAINGVLISGQRGTAKSTAVRAFARMVYGKLPVTLPINATDDRIIGGWDLYSLMKGEAEETTGLLEEAGEKGMLYVDEVNLLDDHIVNLILDVASTKLLTVQREGIARVVPVAFTLVGTMNPEEGSLRPQLLDRFGLLVNVAPETDRHSRRQILETVIRFDEARRDSEDPWLRDARDEDARRRSDLESARERLYDVDVTPAAELCAQIAERFDATGHRGDYVMALAARAHAALAAEESVGVENVQAVAAMALAHRRPSGAHGGSADWSPEAVAELQAVLSDAGA